MQPLSKTAEQKLIGAIEKAAEYVNTGLDPNAAIVKSAREKQIPPGQLGLMVHAYNTGRTNKQREQGDTVYEKSADFNLADLAEVKAALFPETVKTSAELQRDAVVSTEYAISPRDMAQRHYRQFNKAAAAEPFTPTYQAPPRDDHAAAVRRYSAQVVEKRAAEELRRQATAAQQTALNAMDKVAEYFRYPGHMPFGDAVVEVERRFGASGSNLLTKVAAAYPALTKQAATGRQYFGMSDPLYALVNNATERVNDYVSALNKLPPTKEASPKKKFAPQFNTGSVLVEPNTEITLKQAAPEPPSKPKPPGKPKPSDAGPIETAFNTALNPVRAMAETLYDGNPVQQGFNRLTGFDKSPSELKQDAYSDVTAPEHELRLKNIRAQAALHDLLMNDPVISGYDPEEVASAFNEVSELSPSVVANSAALRASLRKRLESGELADFDVKQLVEMDKLRAERDKARLQSREIERNLI